MSAGRIIQLVVLAGFIAGAAAAAYLFGLLDPLLVQTGVQRASAPPPPAVVVERLGEAPEPDLRPDPSRAQRWYSGGFASDDGARTWRPLTDADGRTVRLLGGHRAVPSAPGPNGRLLLGEVIFDVPGTPFGRGPIAHAVEWTGSAWRVLADETPATPASNPASGSLMPVNAVAYLPDGDTAVLADSGVELGNGGGGLVTGRTRAFLAASDGSLWVSVERPTGPALLRARGRAEPFLPVGGAGRVSALAEDDQGTVLVASDRLGRRRVTARDGTREETWVWTRFPPLSFFSPEGLAASASFPLLAIWGSDGTLYASLDRGATLRSVLLKEIRAARAAVDPASPDTLVVLDRDRGVHRVRLRR